MQDISLITTIAFGLTAALVLGLGACRVGLSPIVGYLLAGVAIGPHTPGFVGDVGLAIQLAEIGVILLMFGVGMHFHLGDLIAVRSIALPGALGQSAAATLCGLGVALAVGWTWNAGLVLGIAISVASTVVLIRVLTDAGLLESTEGRVAVGWLLVEDILTVLVLVILPNLALTADANSENQPGVLFSMLLAVGKLVGLGALMLVAGARFFPSLLLRIAKLRSSELFTLAVLVMAMAVATLGYLAFGASMALGAFLAGMVVGQSKVSHEAAAKALPMRDAFAVLFFVAVGMLFDWRVVFREPWLVLGTLVVVLLVKPVAALLIVLIRRHTLKTGLVVAGGLGQIGEFSFIVAAAAKKLGILPSAGHDAIVAAAIVSISLNPWFVRRLLALETRLDHHVPRLAAWIQRRAIARGKSANLAEAQEPGFRPEVVIVGYGPVGRSVEHRVAELGMSHLVIDMNVDTIVALQAQNKHALFGDATQANILAEAGVKHASYVVVTLPDAAVGFAVINAARALNPEIKTLVRARYLNERDLLEQANPDAICYDEAEAATALSILLRAHARADACARDLPSNPGPFQ